MLNGEASTFDAKESTAPATAGHPPALSQPRVDHVGIMVPDLDQGVEWYVGNLGFTLQDRWANPGAGMEWAHLVLGDFMLELVTRPGLVAPASGTAGYHHLAITVDDCHATVTALEARGVAVMFQPSYFERHHMDWSFIQDLFGNVIELISYRTPGSQTA
jgi:catechol 2,3-dioxygenase-like lactoylglutathione lyase family enzyme